MDQIVAFLAENVPIIVAGVFGGIMRWVLYRTRLWDGLLNMLVGGTLAYYVTPIAAPAFAPWMANFVTDIPKIEQATAFGIGVIGVAMLGAGIDAFRRFSKKKLDELSGVVPEPQPPKAE